MHRTLWLGLVLTLNACATPETLTPPGLRVGQEVDGQRLLESRGPAERYLDVLCVPGPGVSEVTTGPAPQHDGWSVSWTGGDTTCSADLRLLTSADGYRALVERIPDYRLELAWPDQGPLLLELHLDGTVGGGD